MNINWNIVRDCLLNDNDKVELFWSKAPHDPGEDPIGISFAPFKSEPETVIILSEKTPPTIVENFGSDEIKDTVVKIPENLKGKMTCNTTEDALRVIKFSIEFYKEQSRNKYIDWLKSMLEWSASFEEALQLHDQTFEEDWKQEMGIPSPEKLKEMLT